MSLEHERSSAEPNVATLVGGIVEDLQTLVRQQLLLTRREVERDVREGSKALGKLLVGAAVGFLGAIALTFSAAHLLHWATAPAGFDPARVPLWASFGLVGIALTTVGCFASRAGLLRLGAVQPLQTEAEEAWKGSAPWTNEPK